MEDQEGSNSTSIPSDDNTISYLSLKPVNNTVHGRDKDCHEACTLTIQQEGENPKTSCDPEEPDPKEVIVQNLESQREENSVLPPEMIQRYQRIRRNLQPLMGPHDTLLTPDMYSLPNDAEIFPCHTRRTQAEFMAKMLNVFQHLQTSYKEGLGITILASGEARQKLQEKEKYTRLVFLNYIRLHLEDWENSLETTGPGSVAKRRV